MRVLACHLLNDYSGSPKVLKQLLKGWVKNNLEVHLFTCGGREGFLSNLTGVKYHNFWYAFTKNPYLRLVFLLVSQLLLMLKVLTKAQKDDIIYVNTVLPFGAAIAGKIRGIRVIYHIHETSIKPAILKKILFGIVERTADQVVYVSNYLANEGLVSSVKSVVLHNAIEEDWYRGKKQKEKHHNQEKHVLMVCSLKAYKGVNEYIELARSCPDYVFSLVMNSSQNEIDAYFKSTDLPRNLRLFDTQTNLHPFYNQAHVVLNLSKPDGWVETFGLTIIEAMAYQLPAIIPPVGGITELVSDGINGYRVNSTNLKDLKEKLELLLENPSIYNLLSLQAEKKFEQFREGAFIKKSLQILAIPSAASFQMSESNSR
ncbi:glycosyl transferase family 1 [Marivirga lumbricoides]|uniref:Glycosyl transferase family 1 n=1 Tax=Marivirga lumbricoides TaxID=1046115 RepID=A0A2T4DG68_9BACT|nr:glycosyl transferase family 1 [Marivirga lumbricoides]